MASGYTIDNNTYYASDNINIFPSSNAVDSGKLFTELNGRNITINITNANYVVSPNPGGYDLTFVSNAIDIAAGKASINGFEVTVEKAITHRLPNSTDDGSPAPAASGIYEGYYLLCLHTLFDALNNIYGNINYSGDWYCGGIRVEYVDYATYSANPNEYLLLGGVKTDGTILINSAKYSRFNSKYMFVNITPDPDTEVPPAQTVSLETFINNILKSYWVSKLGDNEYGSILFKNKPNNYLDAGFEHSEEDSLDSNTFGVKIKGVQSTGVSTSGGLIVVKPHNNAISNNDSNTIQINQGTLGFYSDSYKGDDNSVFDEKIVASSSADTNYYTYEELLDIWSKGNLRLETNNGSVFAIEQITNSIDNVEPGRVIYAKNNNNIHDKTINYLYDSDGNIKTTTDDNLDNHVVMDSINHTVDIKTPIIESTSDKFPKISLEMSSLKSSLYLSDKNIAKGTNNSSWNNVAVITDNLKVSSETDSNSLGSLQAEGFIYAGVSDNPAATTVSDVANNHNNRTLKSGDIYGSQVWSAVYNDIAEIFDLSNYVSKENIIGLVLAIDSKNPNKFTVANKKYDNCVVGIVSENPAFCAGGAECENGVPVALAGRVKVKYEGKKLKTGDFVGLSNKTPGYVKKCSYLSKYRVGKVLKVIDKEFVEILVIN